MHPIHLVCGHRQGASGTTLAHWQDPALKLRANRRIGSRGVLYAHALAIAHESGTRYRELATRMVDSGNDALAALLGRLAEFEAEHAVRLAKKSMGIEIPVIDSSEHAWLERGPPVPGARAFIFRMMTPRLALEIALQAEKQAKAFFERVRAESRNAKVRALAAELAGDEASHIACITRAIALYPQPRAPGEDLPGDPTIEQQI